MQNSLSDLQQQLQKLILTLQFVPLQKCFISGYILKDFGLVNAQTIKDLLLVIQFLLDIQACQIITQQNTLELIVVFSHVFQNLGKHGVSNLVEFYQNCINQLVNDKDYIKNKYFQRKQEHIQQGKISQSNYINQSNVMGLHRNKSNLAQCPVCLVQIMHADICVLICGHIIHKGCFQQCMKDPILNKRFPLKCPFEECGTNIQIQDIEEYLPKQLLEKYYQFTLHNFVDKNSKNVSWCPTAGCSSVFQFDQHIINYRCRQCQKNYCMRCKTQTHTGISCQQNKQSMNLSQDDKKFLEFVKGTKYKQCPKCKFWVQKSHGCCHMTCRCAYQFCYNCGVQYGKCNCESQFPQYYQSDNQDQDNQDQDQHQYEQQSQSQIQHQNHSQQQGGSLSYSRIESQIKRMHVQE